MTREACTELARSAGRDPEEIVEWWTERAAIREHDGGQPRGDAEASALDDVRALVATTSLTGERIGPKRAQPTASSDVSKRNA